jgi:hypothetical protein
MIESYKNSKYKVKTPDGYKDFVGIRRTSKANVVHIDFQNGTQLECSLDHRFVVNGKEILGKDVIIGQELGPNKIISNTFIKENKKFLYDLIGVDGNSLYIADDIISHNCDFSTSGNTVVSPDLITYYRQTYMQEPLEKRGFDGNLWVWEIADYTKNYIVCADVARGDGSDYSAFHIIEVESCRQVAEYRGQIGTKEYGNMLVAIATEYNDALLVVENANVGWATLQQIIDRGYRNLYYTYKDDVLDSDKFLIKGYDLQSKSNMVAGFTMSSKTRPLAISKMELYIREKSCIIRSVRLLEELYVFIWKSGRAEAAQGYNDDLIMSFCSGLWVRDTALKLRQAGIEINRAALSNIKSSVSIYKPASQRNDWRMDTTNGEGEDITWLL